MNRPASTTVLGLYYSDDDNKCDGIYARSERQPRGAPPSGTCSRAMISTRPRKHELRVHWLPNGQFPSPRSRLDVQRRPGPATQCDLPSGEGDRALSPTVPARTPGSVVVRPPFTAMRRALPRRIKGQVKMPFVLTKVPRLANSLRYESLRLLY